MNSPTKLVMDWDEARRKLEDRIEKGKELLERQFPMAAQPKLEASEIDLQSWSKYNRELLRQMFSDATLAEEFDRSYFGYMRAKDVQTAIQQFQEEVRCKVATLKSISERLELMPRVLAHQQSHGSRQMGSKVFVVHGHDNEAKESVARFIEKLGLSSVVLHEQTSQGNTIIEKFERSSENVAFAVVLLTPDDMGGVKGADHPKPRARQNVVFELGYFVGKLGRSRVCALTKGGVELPSDYNGVLYVSLDREDWRFQLAKEMKDAKLEIDLNKAI